VTKLLVSVRDVHEARTALDAGVDLIDIKEPRRGSLGKADDAVISEIAQLVNGRRAVSAALGELADYTESKLTSTLPCPALQFAKVGLAGCGSDLAWPRRLVTLFESMPASVGRVAVIYADWRAAGAPAPHEVLRHAANLNCRGILIDTFDKSLPGLTTLWPPEQIQEMVAAARSRAIFTVLAGRISTRDVAQLLLHRPNYLAVRGAVCVPDRNGTVEATRILSLRKLLAANSELAAGAPLRIS
jgi:(5-formylfuran-3-yl)methyl phosphate synthase